MSSYLEHMAIRVSDLEWHIRFFDKVFGMTVKKQLGEAPNRKVWLQGGLQLNETTDFDGPEGRADHLGIMADDVESALDRAYESGAKELPQGRNWLELPDGLCIEVITE